MLGKITEGYEDVGEKTRAMPDHVNTFTAPPEEWHQATAVQVESDGRRTESRQLMLLRGQLHYHRDGKKLDLYLMDLNEFGFRALHGPFAGMMGQSDAVVLGLGDDQVRLEARLVRSKLLSSGWSDSGFEFLESNDSVEQFLRQAGFKE